MDALHQWIEGLYRRAPLGTSKHTSLRNQFVYFRLEMKASVPDAEKAVELESVLSMRDLTIYTEKSS